MDNKKLNYWFEKIMAVLLLLIIIGLILFFNFFPMETESENVIMIILGVLIGVSKDAIPHMLGVNDDEQELRHRIQQLETQVDNLMIQNKTLKTEYDKILKVLIDNYVAEHPIGGTSNE